MRSRNPNPNPKPRARAQPNNPRPARQPTRAAGAQGTRPRARPVSRATTVVGSLAIPLVASGSSGTGAFVYPLRPKDNNTDWWCKLASLYNRFRFKHLTVAWKPGLSAMSNGNIAVSFDSSGQAPTLTPNFGSTSQSYPRLVASVHTPAILTVPQARLNRLPWYDCQDDAEDGTVGYLLAAWTSVSSSPAIVAGQDIGYLSVTYTLELTDPTNELSQLLPLIEFKSLTQAGSENVAVKLVNRAKRALAFDCPQAAMSVTIPPGSATLTVPLGALSEARGRLEVYSPTTGDLPAATLATLHVNRTTSEWGLESGPVVEDVTDPANPFLLPSTFRATDFPSPLTLRAAASVFRSLRLE